MWKVSNIEEQWKWSVIRISKLSAHQIISFDMGSYSFGKLSRKMQAERQKQALEKIYKKKIDTEQQMTYKK